MNSQRIALFAVAAALLGFLFHPGSAGAETITPIPQRSEWRYLDDGSDQGTAWREPGFDDTGWSVGAGELGYGDGDEATVLSYGDDPFRKARTSYFRHTFTLAEASGVESVSIQLRRDDGASVYLNGTEVIRDNLPTGTIDFLTPALTWNIDEDSYRRYDIPVQHLRVGTNTVAVEVHQFGWASSDISFDLALSAQVTDAYVPPPTTTAAAPTTLPPTTAPPTTAAPTTTTTTTTTTTAPPTTVPPTTTPPTCAPIGAGSTVGTVADTEVVESSGLAVGVRSPGVLYTHNDSGDSPRFFALAADGRPLGRFTVNGASASDWEDMAVGPGPVPGQSYLWFADFGGPRNPVAFYRVPEPSVDANGPTSTATVALDGAVRFDVHYPDGDARNAESVLVDPVDGSVTIVTKTSSGTSEVLRFAPDADGGSVTPALVRTIAIPGGGNLETTGGAVSRDGSQIAVRTYDRVLRWDRPAGTRVADALADAPCVDRLAGQRQGEAVAFAADGRSLLISTEGPTQAITAHALP